jgi:hypothetical protein
LVCEIIHPRENGADLYLLVQMKSSTSLHKLLKMSITYGEEIAECLTIAEIPLRSSISREQQGENAKRTAWKISDPVFFREMYFDSEGVLNLLLLESCNRVSKFRFPE